ncbi:hypothetical protein D9M72_529550 [compost metagenome]
MLDSTPPEPLSMAAGMPASTRPASAAPALSFKSPSHSDFVGPETPTGPLPDLCPGSALEVIRSQSSCTAGWQGRVRRRAALKFYMR